MKYDVVTLGETMLRLTPPLLRRIEQTVSLDIEIGGSESNTAVGLARLGLNVAWLSRLTENALGQLINQKIRGYGVDTAHVKWTPHDRIGLYFLEEGATPRAGSVIYDRANSAMSRITPEDLPEDLFQSGNARLLHLTGITPALSESAKATCQKALEMALAAGWQFSFDLNYRAKLWSPVQAQQGCDPFAKAAHLLIAPVRDARAIYELPETEPEAVIARLSELYPQATIVLTLGKDGALGKLPGKTNAPIKQEVFAAQEVGRVGGGDSFAAGLLYGYLQYEHSEPAERLRLALRWGTAVAALKYSTPGDMPIINYQEALQLVNQTGSVEGKISR
jgi:2-dehydro-3-deoxygluconokinase